MPIPVSGDAVLDAYEHADIVDIASWAGQLLLQHGAETQLVEETVLRFGKGLGCDSLDVYISPNAMVLSSVKHGNFLTKTRRVPDSPVNMTVVSCIVRLCWRVEQGLHTRSQVRDELQRILDIGHHYTRWQIVFCIGLACAAFCKLFGGGIPEMAVTFVASSLAMLVRQELSRHRVNLYITVGATAFTATVVASCAQLFSWGSKPESALAAAVLLLIPGIPFINSIQDMIKGYTLTGMARWTVGTLITLSIALGMILALSITKVAL